MSHIAGCVVQADVAKAKKVEEQKQKAPDQANSEDDDKLVSEVAKKTKVIDARDARKREEIEQANRNSKMTRLRDSKMKRLVRP